MTSLARSLRDLSERQSQLFLLINDFVQRYDPSELQPLVDDDLGEAAAALAATFETAARGVIYEHRPTSPPAARLASALKTVIAEAGQHGGSAFERDAAVVLRRIEEAAREAKAAEPTNRRAYIDQLARLLTAEKDSEAAEETAGRTPRLIVP
jgi:hypothetical protein